MKNYHLALAALLFPSSLVIQLFSSVIHHLEPVLFSVLQSQNLLGITAAACLFIAEVCVASLILSMFSGGFFR